MELFDICVLIVLACFLALLLRAQQPEQALAVELLAGIAVIAYLLWKMRDVFERIEQWAHTANVSAEYVSVLVKAVGICLLTQLSADTCRDAGEQALAAKAELAGKCFLLLLSLPIFEQLLSLIIAIVGGEGGL